MKIILSEREPLNPIATLGGQNTTLLDKLCALMLALTPIFQHYYGLYENMGFTLYLLILPIMGLRLLKIGRLDIKRLTPLVPLLLYEAYMIVMRINSVSRILYGVFLIMMFVLICSGHLNVQYFLRCVAAIGCIATCLILVQYASYYLLHRPLNLEPHSILLPENSRWVVTVTYNTRKLYRPSGFFLEPSHVFLYTFPVTCLCLLTPGMDKWRMRTAIILSAGVVLSTSGMGIFVLVGIWGLYLMLYRQGQRGARAMLKQIMTRKNITLLLLAIVALVCAYFFVPFVQKAVNRIFVSSDQVSAISGRTRRAGNYIKTISGKNMLFGTAGVNADLDFSTSGFYATYIRWGIFGLIFSYWFYIQGLFKLKGAYFWFSALMLLLSIFTAHTHGTFYMVYFVTVLMNGYYERRNDILSRRNQPPIAR